MLELLVSIKYLMSEYLLLVVWLHWERSHWYKDLNWNFPKHVSPSVSSQVSWPQAEAGEAMLRKVSKVEELVSLAVQDLARTEPRPSLLPPPLWSFPRCWLRSLRDWLWVSASEKVPPSDFSFFLSYLSSPRGDRSLQPRRLLENSPSFNKMFLPLK